MTPPSIPEYEPEKTWRQRHPVATALLVVVALLGGLYVWNN